MGLIFLHSSGFLPIAVLFSAGEKTEEFESGLSSSRNFGIFRSEISDSGHFKQNPKPEAATKAF